MHSMLDNIDNRQKWQQADRRGAQRDCPTWAMLHAPWLIQLFTLYVDGLEKYLLETADVDAPTHMGILVPLLLYAENLVLMSESA